LDKVKVLLHRESIVHSLVEFVDGSVKAQLGPPDMRIPIQYALGYPERVAGEAERLDLARVGCLSFGEIDLSRYPCLSLALDAARLEASYPAALSAANEVAVELFLRGDVSFGAIPRLVERVLEKHRPVALASLEDILHVDEWARTECLATARNSGEGN
jgi:1-deoxy-D-xylulose-5-phosphate reductoisomerase